MCYAVQFSMISFGVRSYPCAATFIGYQVIFVLSRTFLTFFILESSLFRPLRREKNNTTQSTAFASIIFVFLKFVTALIRKSFICLLILTGFLCQLRIPVFNPARKFLDDLQIIREQDLTSSRIGFHLNNGLMFPQ